MVVVGNTTMIHLFVGEDPTSIIAGGSLSDALLQLFSHTDSLLNGIPIGNVELFSRTIPFKHLKIDLHASHR